MSRHGGVSCDACLLGNFRGRRYKCLICYDYDLCSSCYESGAATTHHSSTHAMQCILTRSDHELFYSGESSLTGISGAHLVHSYTCPFCAKPGFTEATLVEHVTSQHADAPTDVVCPICASLQGGDPNHVTSDFSVHLTLEHRSGGSGGGGGGAPNHQTTGGNGPRDLISFLDEPGGGGGSGSSDRGTRGSRRVGRGALGSASTARARRAINLHNPINPPPPPALSNLAFSDPGAAAAAVAAASSGASREATDPIAELLSQLSGVRRSASSSSSSSWLRQLQMQLQYAAASTQHHASSLAGRQEQRLARQGATRSGLTSTALSSNAVGPSSSNLTSSSGGAGGGISGMWMVSGFAPSVSISQFAQHLPPQFTSSSSGMAAAESRSMHHHPQYQQQAPQNLAGVGGSEPSSSSSVAGGGGVFSLANFASALPSKDGPLGGGAAGNSGGASGNHGFLLRQLSDDDSGDELTRAEALLAKSKKSLFVQELVLSTLISRGGGDHDGVALSSAVAPDDGDRYPEGDTQSDYEEEREGGDDEDDVAPFGDPEDDDEYHDDKVSVCSSDSSSDLS